MPSFHNIDLASDQYNALTAIERCYGQTLLPKNNLSQTDAGFQMEAGQVTWLSLYKFGGEILPEEVWELRSLRRLFVLSGNLSTLNPRIGDLKDLEDLHIARNKINTLPEEIGNLSSLKELHVDQNQLHFLPSSIGQLTNLETLILHENPLETLPVSIGNLQSLKTLGIENTSLRVFPTNIGQLASLEMLFTGGENIGEDAFPPSFIHLSKLMNLQVEESPIESIPPVLFSPPNLKRIGIRRNSRLTNIPDAVGDASQLEGLWLDHNRLSSLPESIGCLENLQYLMLSNNPLTQLPASWGNLRSLRVLWLDGTSIHGPWPAVGNFPSLEKVYLPGVVPDTAESWVNALLARGCQVFWGPNHKSYHARYTMTDPYKPRSQ